MTYGGVSARGLANEDLTWEVDDDEATAYSDMRGNDGIIVYNGQTKGTATITLQANSPTNALWSTQYATQKASGVDVPLMMYDRNDDTKAIAFAPKSTVQKSPPFNRGSGEPVVAWTFIFPTCVPPLQGGSA